MTGRFPIEDVSPVVACGRYPAKAVVGDIVPVSARAYREGHDALGCMLPVIRNETEPFGGMVSSVSFSPTKDEHREHRCGDLLPVLRRCCAGDNAAG